MCRLLGWAANTPLTARDLLGDEGLMALHRLAHLHADGWGMAYDGVDGLEIARSTLRADLDPAFASATTSRATQAAILHLRWATPGLPVEPRNTHPFLRRKQAFAHNGAIHPVTSLDHMLAPPWRNRMQGTTDSERYFLAILAELDESGTDVPTAIGQVVRRIVREFEPSSLNALLETPTALYAISCHDPAAAPSAAPPVEGTTAEVVAVDPAAYFDLQYKVTREAVVVSSSGFVSPDIAGWQVLANDTVLAIDRATLATQEISLDSGLGTDQGQSFLAKLS